MRGHFILEKASAIRLDVRRKGRVENQLGAVVADHGKRISCDDVVRSSSGSDKGRRSGGREGCAAALGRRQRMTGSASHAMTLFSVERQR